MKISALICTFLFLNITLFADAKWIPIEPINSEKKSEKPEKKTVMPEVEMPQLNRVNMLLESAKVLIPLIDKKPQTQMPESDTKKNWYKLENMESN